MSTIIKNDNGNRQTIKDFVKENITYAIYYDENRDLHFEVTEEDLKQLFGKIFDRDLKHLEIK